MATTITLIKNVVTCDDRNGNHYWIFDVPHVTGTDTNVEVPNTILSAAQVPDSAATAGDVTIVNTSSNDAVREIQIDTGETTGTKKIIARFRGSPAGMGSGHVAL